MRCRGWQRTDDVAVPLQTSIYRMKTEQEESTLKKSSSFIKIPINYIIGNYKKILCKLFS